MASKKTIFTLSSKAGRLVSMGLCLLMMVAACTHKESKQPDPAGVDDAMPADGAIPSTKECPDDIMCTAMFASVGVTITGADRKPVLLDSFTSIRLKDKTNMFPEKANILQSPETGNYPVADDNNLSILPKAGDEIMFTGYKDGKEIVKEKYVIGHDCCHVLMVSGKKEIILNQ